MSEITIGLIVSMRIGVACMCDVCVYLRRQVDSGSWNVNQNLDDVGPHNVKRTGAGGTAPVRVSGERSRITIKQGPSGEDGPCSFRERTAFHGPEIVGLR